MMSEWRELISMAEIHPETPEIDLHGMTLYEAESELGQFLDKMFRMKERVVKVIHGKGGGKLAREVPILLKENSLVEFVASSKNLHELGAVVYVIIKG